MFDYLPTPSRRIRHMIHLPRLLLVSFVFSPFGLASGTAFATQPPASIRCEAPESGDPPSPTPATFTLPQNPLRKNGSPVPTIGSRSAPSPNVTSKPNLTMAEPSASLPSTPSVTKTQSTPPNPEMPAEEANVEEDKKDNAMLRIGTPPETLRDPPSIEDESDSEPTLAENESEATKSGPPNITKKRVRNLQEEPELQGPIDSDSDNQTEQDHIRREIDKAQLPSLRITDRQANAPTTSPPKTLTAQQKQLKQRLETCIAYYLFRPESIIKRSPWAVMHALLPFGLEAEVTTTKGNVNAIGWMCFNGKCRTQRIFVPKNGGFNMAVGPGVQGHEGQFLAMLAQSNVSSTYPIQVADKRGTIQDIIKYEMAGCKVKTELTFKLIGLSHYLPSDETWHTDDGVEWSISKLIEEELAQPIIGAACGGTHRLMGLTYSVQRRQEQGLPIDDQFLRAELFVTDFRKYAWSLQNPDGSFSTKWFEGRASEPDMEKKVQTTGHILEWLIYATPEEELNDPRIVRALQFLVANLYDRRDHDWPIGPRGHALRAMNLYDQRFFGATAGKQRQQLAGPRRTNQPRR